METNCKPEQQQTQTLKEALERHYDNNYSLNNLLDLTETVYEKLNRTDGCKGEDVSDKCSENPVRNYPEEFIDTAETTKRIINKIESVLVRISGLIH